MNSARKLSNVQLEILKLFSIDLSEVQLKEIKELLSNYFNDKITNQMGDLFVAKDWKEDQIDKWSNEYMRTSYKS